MDFELNDEQRMIVETAEKIARRFGPDYWLEKETKNEFPSDFVAELGGAGFLGFGIPEAYGGNGLGMTEGSLAFDVLGARGGGAAPGLLTSAGLDFRRHVRAQTRQRRAEKEVFAEDRGR